MKTKQEILPLLTEYARAVKKIYGAVLSRIILYGSYARGDYREDSDIDIMILLDVQPREERKNLDELAGLTADFNANHDICIMPMPKSVHTFRKWEGLDPFYKNVGNEGVVLLGA